MRWEDGSPVTRVQVRRILGEAAEEFGIPKEATGTHSLRVGGASALYLATGGNKDLVQRLGRWSSDAFQGYIWEDPSWTAGLASSMLRTPWGPHMAAF